MTRASDRFADSFRMAKGAGLRRIGRYAGMAAGAFLVAAGAVIAPLPGPFGLPIAVVGLALILRSSFWAKRLFIRAQRARPNWVYPFRRLLRKRPEVAAVFWQQALRLERMVLKKADRVLQRLRRWLRGPRRPVFA